MDPVDRPVFVLGERAAATRLIHALDTAPTLCAMPINRLLRDLLMAVEHSYVDILALVGQGPEPLRLPADWYRDLQRARAQQTGKLRTVDFSGLAVPRLHHMFPHAQFLVVHASDMAIPRSRRLPRLAPGQILEMGSGLVTKPAAIDQVLAFLGEPSLSDLVAQP